MDGLSFDEAKARLDEIADAVEDPAISLDDALALYEEAVKIGLHACEVSEQDVLAADEEPQADADVDVADASQEEAFETAAPAAPEESQASFPDEALSGE